MKSNKMYTVLNCEVHRNTPLSLPPHQLIYSGTAIKIVKMCLDNHTYNIHKKYAAIIIFKKKTKQIYHGTYSKKSCN